MATQMWNKKAKNAEVDQTHEKPGSNVEEKAKKEELDPTHEKLTYMTMIHTYEEGKRMMMVMVSMRMMVWNWMVM